MKYILPLTCTLLIHIHLSAAPRILEALKDENALRADHWIYNDIEKAKAEARRLDKPIFVTFRCVPCEACRGFDAEVAGGSERITRIARQHFVSLRQIEMKAVDLSQFQFDYDLNWAAMFINADGTVYGRYGTQSAEGPDAFNSIPSLEKAMLRVVELHRNYPKNKALLTDKKGHPKPYKTALQMPGLPNKDRYAGTTERNNCIHCHNIHDAEYDHMIETGRFSWERMWRYPLPDNLGIHIDREDGQRVGKVRPGSPASIAGLKPNDRILQVNKQAIISIADIQWILHNQPDKSPDIQLAVQRGRSPAILRVKPQPGWKKTDISWRGSLWNMRPRMRVWTPDATAGELKRLGLPPDGRALKVKWINRKSPEGGAAYNAGLREGDFIIGIENKPVEWSHRQLNAHIKLKYKPGEKFPVTLWRKGRKIQFAWPLK